LEINRVICGDCLEVLKDFPDNLVDAIVTDPPYFKVKKEWWDRQWDKPEGFLSWLDSLAEQWQRVLKPNGSLYCFASPRMAARVEVLLGERFNVLNHIVWNNAGRSRAALSCKEDLRGYLPHTERIIFCEHYGADNMAKGEAGYGAKCDELRGFVFETLRAYLDGERIAAGLSRSDVDRAWQQKRNSKGIMAHHWFGVLQFGMPTPEHYHFLQSIAPNHFRRPYEDLRREYEDLRREYEDLRRPFSVTADVPYADVWTFPIVSHYPGKHPCEKPAQMLEHIITASSRPGALVLDCFAGSGSTLSAAKRLGRNFIGIEIDPRWVGVCYQNLGQAQEYNQQKISPVKTAKTEQLELGF
jgi:site-specific DNA-methyltransferase (adenine-specific)